MELAVFIATQDQTEFSFKVESAVQELQFHRSGPASLVLLGLLAGLPEVISTELTHPIRDRVRGMDNVYVSHAALWAQHGRGQMQEFANVLIGQTTGDVNFFETNFRLYLADQGPLEILADDRFRVTVKGCIPGCTYRVSSPEQQIIGSQANKLFLYEPGLLLSTDRDRRIVTAGKQGIILPNRPDIIDDVVLTFVNGSGEKTDKKLEVTELMSVQADSNANIAQLNYNSADKNQRDTDFMPSQNADLLLIMFNNVSSFLIDNILGNEVRYTVISSIDRP